MKKYSEDNDDNCLLKDDADEDDDCTPKGDALIGLHPTMMRDAS